MDSEYGNSLSVSFDSITKFHLAKLKGFHDAVNLDSDEFNTIFPPGKSGVMTIEEEDFSSPARYSLNLRVFGYTSSDFYAISEYLEKQINHINIVYPSFVFRGLCMGSPPFASLIKPI